MASIRVHEPRLVGDFDGDVVMRALRRARGRMDQCRQPGRTVRVMVHVHVAFHQVRMVNPAPDNTGPVEAARCVARVLRSSLPRGWDPGDHGIIEFSVTLPVASPP